MIYGYIRVSTDQQSTSNQKFEINRYAASHNIQIDKWVEETISSRKPLNKRINIIISNTKAFSLSE